MNSFLEDVEEVELETPYGKPSTPYVIGELAGKGVASCRGTAASATCRRTITYRANVRGMRGSASGGSSGRTPPGR